MKNTYKIQMYGYGGEVVLGHVKRESYEYFVKNDINLEDFAYDSNFEIDIPKEFKPFENDQWYECDNIAHNNGIEMADACYIEITDSKGKEIWKSTLEISVLEDAGCDMDFSREHYASDYPKGNVVFFGQSFEKGGFFEIDLELTEKFDKKKLKFTIIDVEGFITLEKLEYAGEELDGNNGYCTSTKSNTFIFIESDSLVKTKPHNFKDTQLTEWFPGDTNPVHKGMYEIQFLTGRIGSTFADWDGKVWRESNNTVSQIYQREISKWRGFKKK